jgi:hypothetical protein
MKPIAQNDRRQRHRAAVIGRPRMPASSANNGREVARGD